METVAIVLTTLAVVATVVVGLGAIAGIILAAWSH